MANTDFAETEVDSR
jgi:hypothetical protein